ncbi:MAG: hypothetical protein OCD03_12285 [Hyphomicrobiales bacterium]
MKNTAATSVKFATAIAIIAFIFGIVTIYSGGEVIFVDGAGRARAGDYIGFIVWFNFLAGFVYVVAAFGIYKNKHWSSFLSRAIAISTLIAFAVLGVYIFWGGAFEFRTVAAMILRSAVWLGISYFVTKNMRLV